MSLYHVLDRLFGEDQEAEKGRDQQLADFMSEAISEAGNQDLEAMYLAAVAADEANALPGDKSIFAELGYLFFRQMEAHAITQDGVSDLYFENIPDPVNYEQQDREDDNRQRVADINAGF